MAWGFLYRRQLQQIVFDRIYVQRVFIVLFHIASALLQCYLAFTLYSYHLKKHNLFIVECVYLNLFDFYDRIMIRLIKIALNIFQMPKKGIVSMTLI